MIQRPQTHFTILEGEPANCGSVNHTKLKAVGMEHFAMARVDGGFHVEGFPDAVKVIQIGFGLRDGLSSGNQPSSGRAEDIA
jgi:hypothetical protein